MTHRNSLCPCNWKECNDYSYDPGDPWDGVFRVRPLGTQKNDELRRVVEHHLRISQQVPSQRPEYHVRCHHWNRKLIMELLKPDPSNGAQKKLSSPIAADVAKRYNITDQIDRCRIKGNTVQYMASPNNPEYVVKEWLQSENSKKNAHRRSRENRQIAIINEDLKHKSGVILFKRWHPNVMLPPFINCSSRFCGNNDVPSAISSGSKTTPVSIPDCYNCVGINSERIITFSSKSFENKGICLQYWSYSVSDGKFRSANCKYNVSISGEQCANCMEAKCQIRACRHPELFQETKIVPITPSRISTLDASKSMLHLERNNKLYEVTEEVGMSTRTVDNSTTGRLDARRNQVFEFWSKSLPKETKVVPLLSRVTISHTSKLHTNLQLIRNELWSATLDCSYASMLVSDMPECAAYAKASIGLPTESWFCELYKLSSSPERDDSFDAACQRFM